MVKMPKRAKKELAQPAETKIQKHQDREISEELQECYLDYAMSVIVSRALPDARDGLKPVQRRILWSMWDMGLGHGAKLIKSARVVGEVMGKYHPHGDMAIYDTLVRMAQDFSLRYVLIDGQGNFGSIDGDAAAAQRYTEARLSKISEEMLADIEKETVDWQPNYDASRVEPKVLPSKLPNLLLNGSMGIAVGMATNIPPHNLNEIIDAIFYLIENSDASTQELFKFIQGPDFPTGGLIFNKKAIMEAYSAGKGPITMRGVATIEETKNNQFSIIITEIPYQTNKAELILKIAQLITDKKIEGIRDIRDESDREGLRIVIEVKSNAPTQKILNQLYKFTELQKDFHLNMIALADGIQPQTMSLKDLLSAYLEHRKVVVRKRTEFELKRAKERAHILMGLVKALSIIDEVIKTIKKSKDRQDAFNNLIKKFKFSEIQANAILEMKLQTLANLERQRLEDELKEKKKLIAELELILKEPKRILKVIKEELTEVKEKYGDERKTKVVSTGLQEFNEEDLVPKEDVIITLSNTGYIKRVVPSAIKAQNRGGKGTIGSELGEEDFIVQFLRANTHDNILFFTDKGRAFQAKVYEIPVGTRISRGKLVHNFLDFPAEENISAIISYPATKPARNASRSDAGGDEKELSNQFLVMCTYGGMIKKTPISDFQNVRRSGIVAMSLKNGDLLKWVKMSLGKDEVIIATAKGQAIRFKESQLRPMGRQASGVKAIGLNKDDFVAGLDIIKGEQKTAKILVVMENGFSKQTPLSSYRLQSRGGKGIKTAKVTAKTGQIVTAKVLAEEEEVFALSSKGQIIRTKISNIRTASRVSQGVKIMKLEKDDKIAGIVAI
ncbi:MAG: DNA gyrase subunit A [Candidatus Paceibacterota bacterium]|jgi:DNA gyrase subunit A